MIAVVTAGLVRLLQEIEVYLDDDQVAALDARLTALVEEAQSMSLLTHCPVCGCSLATVPVGGCSHGCSGCGMGGGRR